jgi:hypothetical protein
VTVQFTPPFPGSLVTVALTICVPPAVIDEGGADVNTMLSVLTTIENPFTVVTCPKLSVRETLKFKVVADVGVPVTAPVPEFIERPSLVAGVKLQLQVRGAEPAPWKVKLYATLTVADGTWAGVVVITGAAGLLTVIVNAVAAEDCPNVSLTVNVKATDCFVGGVPETTPVLELRDSPSAGRPTAPHVSVPVPLAWKVKEYAVPAVAGAAVTCA